MSAIYGIYNKTKEQPLPPDSFSGMIAALAHYGRGGSHTWQKGPIALGHQLTCVSPESRDEKLPSGSAGLTITADAHLDNREELIADLRPVLSKVEGLRIDDFPFANPQSEIDNPKSAIPDSQLILLAYQKWGLDSPAKFLGDFAFAIWDEREKRLFLARDYPGTRPLYYHAGAKQFLFASDIEALLSHPAVPRDLDYAYLAAHLKNNSHFPHAERTFFAAIKKLPPAHALKVDKQGVKTWAFWQPGQGPEVRFAKDEEYVERLVELYTQAVTCRTRSAFPVGAHLSSGLDSSSVAVLAARALKENGANLAGGFSWSPQIEAGDEYLEDDERLQIKDICEREGFQPFFTRLSVRELTHANLDKQTIPLSTFILEADVCRQAETLGIRTMLSGWGGDELVAFNGRGFFLEMLRRGRWGTCFRELKMRANLHGGSLRSGIFSALIQPWVLDEVIVKLRPDGQLAKSIARRGGQQLPTVFQDDFRSRLSAADELPRNQLNERLGVRPYQLALVESGHMTHRIEGWAAAGARHGIAYAYPLLDRRIIEFALGLPPEMFMKTGWKRWLFRSALEGILPDNVRWNKSKDDPALDANRERRQQMMQEQVIPLLHSTLLEWLDAGGEFHCLDAKRVRAAIAEYRPAAFEEDAPPPRDELISAIQVEQFLNPGLAEAMQAHIEQMGPNA
ncbi:MAG: hypothetical protein KKD28_03735 [Chloroflexi bacterium]|nr:hypothetical protein [Chloroflexota bacterium]